MTLEHDIETIKLYQQWKATKSDESPEAFVTWRAQSEAYDRLNKAISVIADIYAGGGVGEFPMREVDVVKLWNKLTEDDDE